jgi:DNA-binding XRE family transcriptional regulator
MGYRNSIGGNSIQFIKSPQADIILSLTAMVKRNTLSAICNLMMERRDMLTTGNQLKAARALAGIKQGDLAKAARINVATISAMEGKGAAGLTSGMDTVCAIAQALESCGIELLTDGVRLKAK